MSEQPYARRLDPREGAKPLDFGLDGVTGSVDVNGRIIAVNTAHDRHGYVSLSAAPPFPEDQRYAPAAVRAYRAELATLAGFGPRIDQPITDRALYLLDDAIPQVRLTYANSAQVTSTTFAHAGGILQQWRMTGDAPRWSGSLTVQRSAYTQLTEGGPATMPDTLNRVTYSGGVLAFENPALPLGVAIAGLPDVDGWTLESRHPVMIDIPGTPGAITLAIAFGRDATEARERALALLQHDAPDALNAQRHQWRAWLADTPANDVALRRGLVYGRALVTPSDPSADAVAILTDHMLLPLSWNRDAYYVARVFLSWHPDMTDLVRRHLIWLFEHVKRPDGIWGRCYMANGLLKDRAYQLDQQLFPLLELADYVNTTGDTALANRVRPHIVALRDALLARKAARAWLFPTDETPADDPVTLPYHLSSHILLWHTLRQLAAAGLADVLPIDPAHIHAAVQTHFVTTHDGHPLYAYATDGDGGVRLYHDANDLPLALAPAWGFVPADDAVWRATIDFAFSDVNASGYYTNGLGSVHTPAPWPLGTVQALIIAHALNDASAEQRALQRLRRQQQLDGALPEASDAASDRVVSRHWFAWPNAALACELLGAFTPAT